MHRGFHFVLGRLEFFLERIPFAVLGEFVDAIAAAEDVLAHPERLRQLDDVRADVLHLLAVLRFDGDETVRDQTTQIERDLAPGSDRSSESACDTDQPSQASPAFRKRQKARPEWGW